MGNERGGKNRRGTGVWKTGGGDHGRREKEALKEGEGPENGKVIVREGSLRRNACGLEEHGEGAALEGERAQKLIVKGREEAWEIQSMGRQGA